MTDWLSFAIAAVALPVVFAVLTAGALWFGRTMQIAVDQFQDEHCKESIFE